MERKDPLKFTPEVIMIPLLAILALWFVFWLEARFGIRFVRWGIYPLKMEGLKGILFGPFIHSGVKHLFNNTIPLFVLMAALFYFYHPVRWKVLLLGGLFTGIATWFIARPAWHIGASGVIYMLAAFLFFRGIFSRQFQLTALSLLVVFLYGGMLWYLFPIDPKISWEGHLSGFFVGFALALVFRKSHVKNKKYEWEKEDYDSENDPFLRHFDEEGNFIENLNTEEDVSQESDTPVSKRPIKIVYQYRSEKKRNDSENYDVR